MDTLFPFVILIGLSGIFGICDCTNADATDAIHQIVPLVSCLM